MPKSQQQLLNNLEIALLGTIGLGTVAWLARHQIADLFKSDKPNQASPTPKSIPTKKERNFVKVMEQQGRRVIFFFGSQTGTAEDYATRLAKICNQKYGVSAMTADLEEYDLTYLDTVPEDYLVFFVMATYGEGEPTDNATDFWNMVSDEQPMFSEGQEDGPLSKLRYIAFGLGNKTYEHYNAVIRQVDTSLTRLGAQRVGVCGEGDDDGSLEDDFLAWQEDMWPAFCKALNVDENDIKSGPRQPIFSVEEIIDLEGQRPYLGELSEWPKDESRILYDGKRPYNAPVTSRDLFKNTDRHCLHMEFDISGTNLSYQTGDHLAVWPTNNEIEVERLAKALGLYHKLDTMIQVKAIDRAAPKKSPFPVPTTYRTAFRHYLEICAIVPRQTLASLAEFAPTPSSRQRLMTWANDKDEYRLVIDSASRNLAEALELSIEGQPLEGSFSTIPFDLILESLSRLQPRYYSISSSAKEQPKTVSITAVTLQYDVGRTVYGVNTNYLWRLHEALTGLTPNPTLPAYHLSAMTVPIHLRRSQFKLPRNPTVPIIMVGPGTGVAPFRGFVRERALQKQEGKPVGPTLLFFGCRHPESDFLYEQEWEGLFEVLGKPSRLVTAFSRETDQKVYVQHRLAENGQELWDLLEKGAYIYVCGDAKVMAHDVQHAFVRFAQEFGALDEVKANNYVKNLRKTGRYQEDVWS